MATLLRSEYDVIKSRQSLDDFRRLLSLLAEDECIFVAEDEEDANVELPDGRVVGPQFGTPETRGGGEDAPQAENNETEEQHLVSVEPSSPFVSPATEAERVAAEAAADELAAAESEQVEAEAAEADAGASEEELEVPGLSVEGQDIDALADAELGNGGDADQS